MPERTLTVRIIGDDRSLQQAFKRGEKAGKGFQASISGLGPVLARSLLPAAGAAVVVHKAFAVAGQSVDEASAINEEIAKSEQVFGSASKGVISWSETMAGAFGVSQRAALEATGIFGNLFSVVGILPKQAAEMSRSLVELAADMASFNNASPEDVLLAIRSGLVGEAEPLRRYGVLLSEARVQQRAMADTGKENVKSLTNQEKATARYEIILEDTVKAQGDVERTSGSLANKQRELAAETANLEASLGQVLIPTLTVLVTGLSGAVGGINDLIGAMDSLRQKIDDSDFAEGWNSALESMGESVVDFGKDVRDQIPFMEEFLRLRSRFVTIGTGDVPLGPTGPQRGAGGRNRGAAEAAAAEREAKAATAAQKRARKAFAEFEKGMGLKLSKARLTESTDNDLAVLREWERAILRRIKAEGRTFELVEKLTNVRLQISDIISGRATDAAQATSDAFADALDALDLDLEIARSTRGFNDDLRALRAIEAQLLKQIAAEGRTVDLMRRLFQNRQEQAQALRDARNASQFEELGLTAEGTKPTPSSAALLRRAQNMLGIEGLDTKTRDRLRKLVAFLKRHLKDAGRDVRAAVLDMLNDISGAFEEGAEGGQLTTFAKRGADDLIKGLGLSPEQVVEIRSRFSQFGRRDLAPGVPAGSTAPPRGRGPQGHRGHLDSQDVNVNVYIDGQKVEATVTRRQQKKRGRNASSRRGLNPSARR